MASWPAKPTGFRVDLPHKGSHALHPGPYPPDLSRWNSYGCFNTDFSRAPSRLARRTRTIWQYRHVPALSGLLSAFPGVSRTRLPSASIRPLRRPNGEVLSPPLGHKAPRGARFPRSTRVRPGLGRTLSLPRGQRCSSAIESSVAAACRLATAGPCHPGTTTQPGMLTLRGISKSFLVVAPPVLPLACNRHGWSSGPWAFP